MATKATSIPALVYRTSSPFEDRLGYRILQFLRTFVLFFVLLVGIEECSLILMVFAIYSSCNLLHFLLARAKSVRSKVVVDHRLESI